MADGSMDECYQVVLQLAKDAGKLVRDRIWKKKDIEFKSCEVDLVTETDKEVEKLLISGLSSHFPSHKFIGEEATAAGEKCVLTDDPTWIIDPVDGTMNFVHGFPNVCISIGLWKNKIAEIGIIYNPVLEQLFTARKGQGSYMNGTRIHASKETELSKALLLVEMGTSRDPEKLKVVLENVTELVPIVHGTRSLGSAAMNMAMVALGAADAYYEFGIHAWDIAAGDLIVREAGGVCLDPAGGPLDVMSRRMLCAGTQSLANELVPKLKQYYPERD
ncbi:inositol monophosphatase 2-like [Schistocerca nitens]|uniref:inositol monophosphatase 2-like n=1 Tax=Schistocerca nitens TaxID=7011 RepID=UPI002117FB29|nr:inositol monophosphatase 2-like [Schistocerca nitens]